MSRLSERKHYPSDVIFGASLGIVSGHVVARHGVLARFAVAPWCPPGGAGLALLSVPHPETRYESCSSR